MKTSRIPGFYRLSLEERVQLLKRDYDLTDAQVAALGKSGALTLERADHMAENVVGTFELPLGIATNFRINDRDILVPMAIEEPSVVAAASNGAKAVRFGGGFRASSTPRRMIGQLQVVDLDDVEAAARAIEAERDSILAAGNANQPRMQARGGGVCDVRARPLAGGEDDVPLLIVHLVVDTVDAMGANAINTMAESLAPLIEKITGGRVLLRILSNFTDECLARSEVRIPASAFADDASIGASIIDGIVSAQDFARRDPYRAVTHNKGVMNGVDAVVLATGNDWRAVEAAAHAYAARHGHYGPMTEWDKADDGQLVGRLEIPMPIGIIGGATKLHPTAQIARTLLGVDTAKALGEVVVSVGLAQNLSALRALATEGIQRGHMELHARTVASTAGAIGDEVDRVARELVELGDIRVERARLLLERAAS